MDHNNLKFKAISLNVRGIRAFEKRRSIFNWLIKQNANICFLQETYSINDVVDQWKKQWPGECFFSHGSNHSRGVYVAILIRKSLDFKMKSMRADVDGWYLILEASIQDTHFLPVNIYAPNITAKQPTLFQSLSESVSDEEHREYNCRLLLGGDFNVTLQPSLDCSGGNSILKESVKFLEDIIMECDLVDIWRVRNPDSKNSAWRQKNPIIQRRLDYWLISDLLQDDVAKIDIVTAIKTDHSAVFLEIDSLTDHPRGRSFWKFNDSLLDDPTFVQGLRENFPFGLRKSVFVMI